MYFVRNKEETHLSFKNSEKWRTQALNEAQKLLPHFITLYTYNTIYLQVDAHFLLALEKYNILEYLRWGRVFGAPNNQSGSKT